MKHLSLRHSLSLSLYPPGLFCNTSLPAWNIVSSVEKERKKMTAKHRKGKSNHKHEDNFFKNEVLEAEARPGGNSSALLLVLVAVVLLGGLTGTWFCFQQHQTLTYLTDNLMGIQTKIARLQSSHEELRLSNKVKSLNV